MLDTDGVNAFAAPGGFVHVTKGALALMQSEAELADVLGHEIIHVTEKHTVKAIQKSKAKDLGLDVAPGGGLSKLALSKLADAATEAVLAGFGRAEELEADEKGIVLTNQAGYDAAGPRRLPRSSQGAQQRQHAEKRGLFASHPEMDERLKKLDAQIAAAKLDCHRHRSTTATRRPSPTRRSRRPRSRRSTAGAAGLAGGSAPAKTEPDTKGDGKKPTGPSQRRRREASASAR